MPQTEIRNEQWAITQFRPLLDAIDISAIPKPPNQLQILLRDFTNLKAIGLSNCILIVRRRKFKSTVNGYYTFSYKMAGNQPIFFLSIFLNEQLYISNTPTLKIKRRQTLVHEFTHCIAAFLLVEKSMRTKGLIEQLANDIIPFTKMNIRNHYQSLLVQFGSGSTPLVNILGLYTDEHFFLGSVNFQGGFSTLYKHLLLDFSIFEKYFTKEYREQFKEHIQKGNVVDAFTILSLVSSALVASESISADFVKMRIQEQLLSHYYMEALKELMQQS